MFLINLDILNELNLLSVILRLFLSVLCGGILGFERATKHVECVVRLDRKG